MSVPYLTETADPSGLERIGAIRQVYVPEPVDLSVTAPAGFVQAPDADDYRPSAEYLEVFSISGRLERGYWLREPIRVQVRLEGAEFLADVPELGLHAFGESPVQAILDLRAELVEQLTLLEEMGAKVAPRLARQREKLRSWVIPADA